LHRLFRQSDLCPEPAECPEVLNIDPYARPGALPCEGCPRQRLNEYLASPAGALIVAAVDLDSALQLNIPVTLAQIPYHVFLLLRQLAAERAKYQTEQVRNR
jgi:hypothetical protein